MAAFELRVMYGILAGSEYSADTTAGLDHDPAAGWVGSDDELDGLRDCTRSRLGHASAHYWAAKAS